MGVGEELRDYDFVDHGAEGILDYYAFIQGKAVEVIKLEAKNKLLQEYYEASQAVEKGIVDFDLHHKAVERLRRAAKALGGE